MPSGKMDRGARFLMVGVWFGEVSVSPGAMIECVFRLKEKM